MKMKKWIFAVLLTSMAVPVFAQKDAVDQLFDKYGGKDGYTTVYITSKMFSMFSEAQVDDPEFKRMMENLKSIRILANDESVDREDNVNFYDEVMKNLPADEYEELMLVMEKDQKVKFLMKEKDGKVVELLLVVGGKDDNAVIDIRGIIDMKEIAQLSKAINVSGLEELQKLDDSKQKEKK
ncbi:MAG TPA: DUF4252 domain-containing protein [Bacteroidetes bacterium]|nr:DUF4252 domain-containing protein [Bacteroidota bacterium]